MSTVPDPSLPGAHWDGKGVTFSLVSRHAEGVELCLFESVDAAAESNRISLERSSAGRWNRFVPGLSPGQLYGFRVRGPWDPPRGHRFNPAKLLVDPLARAICGRLSWREALHGCDPMAGDSVPSGTDSAPFVPKSVVVDPEFDWEGDRPPAIPWQESVIYECHVRGLTRLHPEVPAELRGTYLGLCHEAVVRHLCDLGVTAVELLPVQQFVSEEHLHRRGLVNYFGYNPLGFAAPHSGYARGDRGQQVLEFKTMVKRLHRAGLEVLLDVVFNHTAEGNHLGPTLSLRGIDNRTFYRLDPKDLRHYQNFSGCGNTLDFRQIEVVELVLACLRYWVKEMHVDGFRFDLAPVLGRGDPEFDAGALFFRRLAEDPELAQVKLIAEPWDVGPHGYQLGRFPPAWSEWNDRYRDTVRALWRGDALPLRRITGRLSGSPDLFAGNGRTSRASINYVACHDGFTLEDLVSYEHKHNWANGEDNRDGHDHNLSRNWGVEGPTASEEINRTRRQIKRNLLATLLLSAGVPMLGHGDELGRSQRGNNNAYCHDNELTWVRWNLTPEERALERFVAGLCALRKSLRSFDSAEWTWIAPHADRLTDAELQRSGRLPFGRYLRSERAIAALLVNPADRLHLFELPDPGLAGHWRQLVNTARPDAGRLRGHAIRLAARALVLLRFEPATAGCD